MTASYKAHKPVGDRLAEWATRLDRHQAWIASILAGVYAVLVIPWVHRHLWFDELHTFYIAQAPSFQRFVDEIRLLDLNPPLSYLLVRASMKILGVGELGARLPSIVGYFVASMSMFVFIARRVGPLWAAAGVGIWWYSPNFFYASEARPYGILLGSLGLLLVSWDYAAEPQNGRASRRWALAGVAVGATGMLLSHVYAPLWVMPFWAAELVRWWKQRRSDWALWAALVLPMAACLTYIPLVQNVEQAVFPPSLQGAPIKAVLFYLQLIFQVFLPLAPATVLAFAIALWRRDRFEATAGAQDKTEFQGHEVVLLALSLVPPVVLNYMAMVRHMAFYPRHALPTFMMGYLLSLLIIAYESRTNRLSGLVAALVIFGFTLYPTMRDLLRRPEGPAAVSQIPYYQIHPELPFVTNSGLTFLEMDRYENPDLVARLYYLVDRDSAIRYDKSNLTEGLAVMRRYFPIRANVSSYADFVAKHKHFLVWGVMDQSGWLLRKLKTEGAHITEVGKFSTVYRDSELSEVTLDP